MIQVRFRYSFRAEAQCVFFDLYAFRVWCEKVGPSYTAKLLHNSIVHAKA